MHNRFDWILYINKAIDEIRRREVKKHAVLKKAWLAILKNEDHRTEKQKVFFQRVQESNLEVSHVWKFQEDFESLFELSRWQEAASYLQNWIDITSYSPAFKKSIRWPRGFKTIFKALVMPCVIHSPMPKPLAEEIEHSKILE